jgi:hypothetical protein
MEKTDAMLENGSRLVYEALREMPNAEKRAYLEALENAPTLVEEESNPVRFLR